MKNLIKKINPVDRSQIVLQIYDKKALDKEHLSKVIGIDFTNGELDKKIWPMNEYINAEMAQIFMQLYDKKLIDKKVLLKVVLGIG